MRLSMQGYEKKEIWVVFSLLVIVALILIIVVSAHFVSSTYKSQYRSIAIETASNLASAYNTILLSGSVNSVILPENATVYDLYGNLASQFNLQRSSTTMVGADMNPLEQLPNHPCASYSGWLLFPNNVVVSGLSSGIQLDTHYPGVTIATQPIYELCIDVNGAKGPNQIGYDIFFGNFHQWGAPWDGGQNVQIAQPFFWGSKNLPVYTATKGQPAFTTGFDNAINTNGMVGSLMNN